ncbi:sensor histidine kinase [Capillimicrobium parvum]|uniref:sensor histidine kinase n=1 Tax=Capillimicrobium parvum TaxID=2884022 RepID=UPI00216B3089|nr:histidine kinase [Capillimicrobium parvum]
MNSRRVAALVWALCAVMAVASSVLLVLGPGRPVESDVFGGVGGAAFLMLSLAFATVGTIVATRLPGNPIGWLFCALGLFIGATVLAWVYADYGLHATSERLPGAAAAASFPGEAGAALLGFALLLFPDGRLPSRRWRPAAYVLALAAALLLVTDLLRPGPLDDPFAMVSNRLGIPGARSVMDALNNVGWALVVVGIVLAAGSLLVRLRRARGVERQQLELVLAVGVVVATVVVLDMGSWLLWPDGELQVRMAVMGVSFAAFPIAAGVAILRYRLYDIDVVVNRTLVYVTLTVLLAAAYGVTTLILGTALGRGSAWTTAGATLAAAVAFRPLRARVQGAVDRRFNRARYDAQRRIAEFLNDLRAGRAAPEAIEALLRELVGDPTLELRFLLPESQLCVDAGGVPVDDLPDDRQRTMIQRAGAPVGIVVHQPARPDERDLLPRLVEAGGLAIEIARLRVELRRQLAEVQASRARIVAAGDEERRRIERDLHDGAQQRLVSIGLAMRHAQHELGDGSPGLAGKTLDAAVEELSVAIQELRELARGLPPAQLDAGLAPALEELAGRAPLPVEVRAVPERLPCGVEAAAYFIACEGLTNAVKHAHASKVVLSAAQDNGTLVVSVADDGIGGAGRGRGSGLSGLSDRVVAQGGTLAIESEPGKGTTLTAELPCGS